MDKVQSRTFNFVKIIAIIMVVYIHCRGDILIFSKDYPAWTNTFVKLFSDTLPAIAVPSFFLISGYLFYLNPKDSYAVKLKKRFYTLFIPYLLWNSISIIVHGIYCIKNYGIYRIFQFLKEGNLQLYWDALKFSSDFHDNVFGQLISNSGPIDHPLWYVRNLMILVLLSPLLKTFIYRFKWSSLSLLSTTYICEVFDFFPGISSLSLFYYSLGLWLHSHLPNLSNYIMALSNYIRILLFITYITLLYIVTFHNVHSSVRLLYIFIGVCVLFMLCHKISETCVTFSFDMNSVVFIFYAHAIYLITIVETYVNSYVGQSLIGSITGYLLVPYCIIAILYIIYRIMQRFMPSILYVLIGRH